MSCSSAGQHSDGCSYSKLVDFRRFVEGHVDHSHLPLMFYTILLIHCSPARIGYNFAPDSACCFSTYNIYVLLIARNILQFHLSASRWIRNITPYINTVALLGSVKAFHIHYRIDIAGWHPQVASVPAELDGRCARF